MPDSSYTTRAIQTAVRDWISVEGWNHPFAVTLTMKQRTMAHYGSLPVSIQLGRDAAVQNMRHFLNVLGKKVYGSAAQRHGKRLRTFSVLEGGTDHRCVKPHQSQRRFPAPPVRGRLRSRRRWMFPHERPLGEHKDQIWSECSSSGAIPFWDSPHIARNGVVSPACGQRPSYSKGVTVLLTRD
jgi:hypothetical protein